MNILEIKGITKIFKTGLRGRVQALDNVDLTVGQGEIFGLLGPNGAGKTTLVKILLGLIRPTAGEASLFGTNVHDYRIRSRLGYLPENPNFPTYLSGRKIMELFGALSSVPEEKIERRIDELLGMMNIKEAAGRKVSTYSKGMIQRLGMAQALISDPDVIFLDEPTDGVDPIGRYDIRAALLHLKNAQKTVFLNSHLLSEVEMLCDRVVIFDRGRVLANGTLDELIGETNHYRIDCAALLPEYLEGIPGTVVSGTLNNGYFDVTVGSVEDLNRVIDSIRRKGALIKSVVPARVSLESYFINLIKDVRRKGEDS